MKKRLLIFAWEYNGYHSVQGAALARRITQVAEAFNSNGWEVTVVHRDQRSESGGKPFVVRQETNGITRIPVVTDNIDVHSSNALIRKAETFYYVAMHGDRTYKWAKRVMELYDQLGIAKPDLIISFYTPKGPISLGNYFSRKFGVPWIADIQDPILAGVSAGLKKYAAKWAHNYLKPATARVHISPEWAAMDAKDIGLDMKVVRHVVPDDEKARTTNSGLMDAYRDSFTIFYGGSISPRIQSVALLKQVIASVGDTGADIKILIAGNERVYSFFKEEFGDGVVKHLGWLTHEVMFECIYKSNCTLVIPWSKERVGIPSKFYEFCSFPKPVWIIGNDLGAFQSLLAEWQCAGLQIDNAVYQEKALRAALKGDYSLMFNMSACKGKVLRPEGFYEAYVALIGG